VKTRGLSPGRFSSREHRLSLIQRRGRAELENLITSIARMKPSKTLSSLFANDVPFPKLAAIQTNDAAARRVVEESFVDGYCLVLWMAAGLAVASSVSAAALLADGLRRSQH